LSETSWAEIRDIGRISSSCEPILYQDITSRFSIVGIITNEFFILRNRVTGIIRFKYLIYLVKFVQNFWINVLWDYQPKKGFSFIFIHGNKSSNRKTVFR